MAKRKDQAPEPPSNRKLQTRDNEIPTVTSILLGFDELMRQNQVLLEPCEEKFIEFVQNQEFCRKRWHAAQQENQRLQIELAKSHQEIETLEKKLAAARSLLSAENSRAKRAEQEREAVARKFEVMREILTGETGNTLNDETRQKLKKLGDSLTSLRGGNNVFSPGHYDLSIVNEVNSTGSILDVSDLSFDATCEGNLEESRLRSGKTYKRKSSGGQKRRSKKSRESDGRRQPYPQATEEHGGHIRSNAVLNTRKSLEKIAARRSVQKIENYCGPEEYAPSAPALEDNAESCWRHAHQSSPGITQAKSSAGPLPPVTPCGGGGGGVVTPTTGVRRTYSNSGLNSRKHMFEMKKVYHKMENCGVCGIRIKWAKVSYKCRDCRAVAHAECRDQVPLPCVGVGSANKTPGKLSIVLALADFTPHQAPMVPAIIIHCINEIESRGMTEVGLYRVPGSEREVKDLKERFLRERGCPNLSKVVDVHVLCGCVKEFLRSLREPLIPRSMWVVFTQATSNPDETDGESALYQAISDLPQPNRDTLAFITLHLKRVSEVKDNKMSVSNLAKILGPTVVGYSTADPSPANMLAELGPQTITMEKLLRVDADYWATFIDSEEGDRLYPNLNILSPATPEVSLFNPLVQNTGLTPRVSGTPLHRGQSIKGDSRGFFMSPMLQ